MSENAARIAGAASGIVTATVRSVSGARVDVASPAFGTASARVAVAGSYSPRAGDGVLVALSEGSVYVIGVVRALREAEERRIDAEDGSSAALEHDEDGPVWRLRDARGRLVVEHRAGKSVVLVEDDLELRARRDVSIAAGGAVRIESGEGALLRADGPVELASSASSLRVDGDRVRMNAPLLEAITDRADVKAKEANLVVGTLRSAMHRLVERAEVVERTAGRVVERAREVYREVEELSQTKAGRLRLVADTALSLLGQSTTVQAREDIKVKGEKIYLG